MSDVWLGILALLAGLLLCFRGGVALRLVIAFWGAFVGFSVGASIGGAVAGEAWLDGPGSWIGAVVGALVFAWLAYAFYAFAVVVAVGSVGYWLGTWAALAVGATPGTAAVVGIGTAVLLAVIALVARVPYLLLVLVSAAGGASAIVSGAMLLVGVADGAAMSSGDLPAGQWWWSAVWFVLAVAGIIIQLRRRPAGETSAGWRRAPRRT